MNIRLAHKSDVAALVALDAPYVENTAMTFECQLPSTEEFTNRIEKTLGNYSDLVVEEEGLQQAMHMFRLMMIERPTIGRLNCQFMQLVRVVVVGWQLSFYDELELLIEQQGIVHFLACIALLNDASISFHKKRGYQQVDHFPKIGYKFGQWHDNNVVTEEFG